MFKFGPWPTLVNCTSVNAPFTLSDFSFVEWGEWLYNYQIPVRSTFFDSMIILSNWILGLDQLCFYFFNYYFSLESSWYIMLLVSAVQRWESVIHYPLFFRVYSHIVNYRVLNKIPCAIQYVLISYLSYL